MMCSCGRLNAVLVSPSLPAEEASRELPYPCSYPGNFSDDLGVNFDFARSQSCRVMIVMLQVASVSMTIGMVTVRSILGRDGSSAQMC